MLAGDNEATEPNRARPAFGEGRIRDRAETIQRRPIQRHDLTSGVEPDHRVGVADPLRFGQAGQRRRSGRWQAEIHRPTCGPPARDALRPDRSPVDAAA